MFLAIITYKYIRLTWEVMASVNCMLCAYLVISLLLLLAYNEAINFFLILYILVITSIIRLTWHYFWFWNPVTQMYPSQSGNSMDKKSQNPLNDVDELHKLSLKMLLRSLLQDAPWFVCRTYKPIFYIAKSSSSMSSFDFNCQNRNQWIMDHVLKLRKCTKAKWHLKTILANSKKRFENCVQVRMYLCVCQKMAKGFGMNWIPREFKWVKR